MSGPSNPAAREWSQTFATAQPDGMLAYDETLVQPLFVPWAELLLNRLTPSKGERLVDVATGPGTVARLAAARLGPFGTVTATDISDAMLTLASGKPSVAGGATIDYRRSPAAPLDVPSESYDIVTCQQGLQFFPDRRAALAEMRRVLRSGGRLGIAVWASIGRCAVFAAMARAMERVMGDDLASSYRGGPWGFDRPAELGALIREAGFRDVVVDYAHQWATFPGPEPIIRSLAASGVAQQVAELSPDRRQALHDEIVLELSPLTIEDGSVCSETASQVAVAIA